MTLQEFQKILNHIQQLKCETQTLEIKKALDGEPSRLYDTLSSFSNQDDGGIIIFGIDESNQYQETGVYDALNLATPWYAITHHVRPLIERGLIKLAIPADPFPGQTVD